jgi:hypothetical protein
MNKPFGRHYFLLSLPQHHPTEKKKNCRVNGRCSKTFNFSKFSKADYKSISNGFQLWGEVSLDLDVLHQADWTKF